MKVRKVQLASGIEISCQLSGDPGRPAMVLLHALGERAASWDEVAATFTTRFYVVALDLRGHGASSWPGNYSFELMRDDVIGVLDDLGLENVIVVGHSMGGVVAYLMAQAQPSRISGLVVEDVAPPFPRTRPVPERPAGALPFDWPVVSAIVAEVNDPSMRWWKRLPQITATTLIIGGGPTSHVPQAKLAEVARVVPACQFITIPVGHHVHEAAPGAFAQTTLDWLGADDPDDGHE
ncbi:alpha/beta hydrolase [soil metagenome]